MRSLKFVVALMFATTFAMSQTLPAGPQVTTFYSDVDDTEQPYGLYLPKNYDAKKKYPFVMMLHGAGSNHRLELRRVFGKSNAQGETDVEASRVFPEWKDVDYIVAVPFARGTMGYQGVAEKDVMDILADVKKRFSIDEDRTYLTGLSMGGGGTLWIGLTRPDLWAAIAPVCPAPPAGTEDLAPNALNFPSWFHHGDKDQAVPVDVSRTWTKKLKDMGYAVEYTEYPGVNHNSWENAYKDGQIFDWFSKYKRDAHPARVRYVAKNYKYNHAYWVTFDQMVTGNLAGIDAKFSAPNTLDITTSNLPAFTLHLAGHPQYDASKPLKVTVDGQVVKTANGDMVSFQKNGAPKKKGQEPTWANSKFAAPAMAKHDGAEGPIGAAMASRHIYVYGTKDNPSKEETTRRRTVAEQAANWSMYRGEFLGRIMVFPRVLSDKEVRPSDFEASNFVLFGTKETNGLIEKYAANAPMELNASAAETHGLVYIMPGENNHYVVVNSGLPFWTMAKQPEFSFVPPALAAMGALKDYQLFKGNNENKIADGYFDNNWNTPAADKTALTGSGVVTVKR